MATIVPVSHSQRWRSRSRNQSTDAMDLQIHVPATASNQSDDEDEGEAEFDNVQTSPWLVVPQGFVSPVQMRSSPVSPATNTAPTWQKAMEMRRASGF